MTWAYKEVEVTFIVKVRVRVSFRVKIKVMVKVRLYITVWRYSSLSRFSCVVIFYIDANKILVAYCNSDIKFLVFFGQATTNYCDVVVLSAMNNLPYPYSYTLIAKLF